MSQLADLITELCPDGVEFTSLGSLAHRHNGINITAGQMKKLHTEGAPVRIFAAGNTIADTEYDSIPYKKVIMIPGVIVKSRGYIGFEYYDRPFTHKNEMWSYTFENNLNPKFTYYYLISHRDYFQRIAKANSVKLPQLSIKDTDNFKVPIPPLPVQSEIVRILDTFTELTEELTEELTARRKQYEYYRDKLLTFTEGVEYRTLGDVTHFSKHRICASSVDNTTYVSVENLLSNKMGKTNANHVPLSGNLIGFKRGDILIGNIRPYLKKIWFADCEGGTNGDVLTIQINDKSPLTPKFLYHLLSSEPFFTYIVQNSKGAKMPRGDKSAVMKYLIPLPPLEVQDYIVSILDRFDKLCNDLTQGLPAEINARRKQYEYYRDTLLTFKQKKTAK